MQLALAVSSDPIPERIGKYPILRRLGHGGTSTVYLATDPFAGREVAIKLLATAPADNPEAGRRYRRAIMNEAALAGRLSHPHIVTLYDAIVDPDCSYLVMEYVSGGTLAPWCHPDNLLPMEQAVEIIFKCALALEYAHQQGVIHRDLKPANILVRSGTDIKVSDFGSAQYGELDAARLRYAGSPVYRSPEQLLDLGLTQQTDIYSLGVIMYQLLTGRLPFYASTGVQLADQIVGGEPTPPSHHRPDLPTVLEAVIMRALARDLRRRYTTWQEFGADLTEAYRSLSNSDAEDSDTERFNVMRKLSFFRDFSEVELWETLAIASFRRFPAQRVVMREGERGECFYVLTAGEVEVTRAGTPLDILTPGDCFGEMLYFSQASARRTTTITSMVPISVLEINSAALRLASPQCQVQFNKAFMRILIDRLTWANAKLAAN